MRSRPSVSLMLILTLMLVLAGCGSESDATATRSGGSSGAAATTSTGGAASPSGSPRAGSPVASPAGSTIPQLGTPTAAQTPPRDDIGVVAIRRDEPFTLAYALVTSGSDASLGTDVKRGIEIAIEDLGGQFFGHKIELIGEDTLCSPEGGQSAATKLAANNRITAIIGTSCSSEARVLAPVIDRAGMSMVSASNTAPDLTDPTKHVPGYLRTAHNDKIQGAAAADFALNSIKVKKAATIHDGSLYAEQLASVFAETFQKNGGQIVAREAVGPEDTDMRPVLTRIAAQAPDLIYFPIFTKAGGFVAQQSRQVRGLENAKLMGADGLFSADFVKAAGSAAQDMYLSSPDVTAFGSSYSDFVAKYQQKYGEKPIQIFHAHGYDATMMVMAAIAKVAVQTPDGTLHIPRKALRDALYATKDFRGITGSITCDANGDCADPKIAVYQVTKTDTTGWPDAVVKKIWP